MMSTQRIFMRVLVCSLFFTHMFGMDIDFIHLNGIDLPQGYFPKNFFLKKIALNLKIKIELHDRKQDKVRQERLLNFMKEEYFAEFPLDVVSDGIFIRRWEHYGYRFDTLDNPTYGGGMCVRQYFSYNSDEFSTSLVVQDNFFKHNFEIINKLPPAFDRSRLGSFDLEHNMMVYFEEDAHDCDKADLTMYQIMPHNSLKRLKKFEIQEIKSLNSIIIKNLVVMVINKRGEVTKFSPYSLSYFELQPKKITRGCDMSFDFK